MKLSLTDLHVYGGALCLAAGVAVWHIGAGIATLGAVLLYLGLRGTE